MANASGVSETVTTAPGPHVPSAKHASPVVHASPSSHAVPAGRGVNLQPAAGSHGGAAALRDNLGNG